jgi:hypothetical protein
MAKRNPPVVITRKDKRLHKGWHLLAFMLTGGASAPVSAAKAGTNAAYNARTRKLAEQSGEPPAKPLSARQRAAADGDMSPAAAFRRDHVPGSKEYRAAHGG